jgi:hypothetical protein
MNKECTTRMAAPASTLAVCPRVLRHGLEQIARAMPAAAGHTRAAWVACTQCWMVGKNLSRPRCGKAKTYSSSPTAAWETRFICMTIVGKPSQC